MNIAFATPETVKMSKGGLVVEKPKEVDSRDDILGKDDARPWPKTCNGHWRDAARIIKVELQRNEFGDLYMCVTFSCLSCHEMIHVVKYGYEINGSDLFLGVVSETQRGRGNSKRKVADTLRNSGVVKEERLPYTNKTTLDEAYEEPGEDLRKEAREWWLKKYKTGYKWLKDNKLETLKEGLCYSPVQVDVQSYTFNSQGLIINNGGAYIHEVLIIDWEENEDGSLKEWWIYDSEQNQFLKYAADYEFGNPMIHSLEKKTMENLYRVVGQAPIGLYVPDAGGIVLFRDGKDVNDKDINGGSIFKAFGLTYAQAQVVKEWPYPIVGVIGTDGQIGSVSNIVPIDTMEA